MIEDAVKRFAGEVFRLKVLSSQEFMDLCARGLAMS